MYSIAFMRHPYDDWNVIHHFPDLPSVCKEARYLRNSYPSMPVLIFDPTDDPEAIYLTTLQAVQSVLTHAPLLPYNPNDSYRDNA